MSRIMRATFKELKYNCNNTASINFIGMYDVVKVLYVHVQMCAVCFVLIIVCAFCDVCVYASGITKALLMPGPS